MEHTTHELVRGFDQAAAVYERGRPEYPPAAVDHLVRHLRIEPGRTIVDLGAGTGKFTRALLGTGARLIGVEPTAGMRAEFRRTLPTVELLDATAEAIPLPDSSADGAVSAQAFHWFDPVRAGGEIARVLRPGAGLGLIWNIRDDSVPWVAELTRILDRRDHGAPRARRHAWRGPLASTGLFSQVEEAVFPHVQRADRVTMMARVLSVSYIAVLPPAEQAAVGEEVRSLLDSDPATTGQETIELPYRTEVFWAYRR